MKISDKQIMRLMANTQILLAIGDADDRTRIDIINNIRNMGYEIACLLSDIINQQSDEVKDIGDNVHE